MKKWKEFSGSEKRMVIVLGVLLLAVILNFGHVSKESEKGFSRFFSSPTDTVNGK